MTDTAPTPAPRPITGRAVRQGPLQLKSTSETHDELAA